MVVIDPDSERQWNLVASCLSLHPPYRQMRPVWLRHFGAGRLYRLVGCCHVTDWPLVVCRRFGARRFLGGCLGVAWLCSYNAGHRIVIPPQWKTKGWDGSQVEYRSASALTPLGLPGTIREVARSNEPRADRHRIRSIAGRYPSGKYGKYQQAASNKRQQKFRPPH
jgi:hypothetical protein